MSDELLKKLGVDAKSGCGIGGQWRRTSGKPIAVRCPIDGKTLATIPSASKEDVQAAIDAASKAFITWRTVPAPQRGELVRRFGQKLREKKSDLAALVQLEAGKITSEALGEVQEMIDVADFAVGLSRQLYGLTIATERAGHRMMEQWHPLGPIGVITAFNFPVAVWAWNAMLAFVCGDPVVWKPSEKTPLTAIACQQILQETIASVSNVPPEISSVLIGEAADVGVPIAASEKLPLISATGSTRMGKAVSETVARRLGRSLLELGGNNGLILTPSTDLDLATRAIVFSAAGTAGQRCTTLRRLIVHKSLKQEIVRRVQNVFSKLKVGDPRQEGILVGPLIDEAAGQAMAKALSEAKAAGATIFGGERVKDGVPGGVYVRPALVQIKADAAIVREETFAPILYVMEYEKFEEAIAIHNSVPQGLASSIFTTDVREAEAFLAAAGSDCGIANVNIGTSGAEIGGAFGGEKQTGGGRESGSDSWKAYMRRVTNTINYSRDLPLAQGVSFDV
jgi:aldehyde dehydrogenase (NAD+)